MMSNLAAALFWDGRIETTLSKAKVLRPYAEKLITKARNGTLHDRRMILASHLPQLVANALAATVAERGLSRSDLGKGVKFAIGNSVKTNLRCLKSRFPNAFPGLTE